MTHVKGMKANRAGECMERTKRKRNPEGNCAPGTPASSDSLEAATPGVSSPLDSPELGAVAVASNENGHAHSNGNHAPADGSSVGNGNGNGNGAQEAKATEAAPPPLVGFDTPEDPSPAADDPLAAAAEFVAPGAKNTSKTMNACRFLLDHGHRLVLAWSDDENAPGVYVLSDTGRLEVGPLLGMLTDTARRYLAGCLGLEKSEFTVASRDATALDSAEGWGSVRKVLRAAHSRLDAEGLIPEGLVVIGRDDVDADLRYVGAPNGVVDLHEARLLPPVEVVERRAFVHCSIPDDYDPEATHPAVDIIMPEKPATDEMAWWYKMRGVTFSRAPNREIVVQMNPPGSGKTTFANADRASFGPDYVKTTPSTTFAKPRFSSGPGSHNSGLFAFAPPTRIVYIVEADADLHPEPMNAISGGESVTPARDVSEKITSFHVTAHMVIQANVPEGGDESSVRLNLGRRGGTDARAALAERLKFILMPALAPEARDPGFPDGNLRDGFLNDDDPDDARRRRQAWVARSVRQAAAMAGKAMPPPLKAMEDLAEERRQAEAPAWEREWLQTALVPLVGHANPVTAREVYHSYLRWHTAEERPAEEKATKNRIGRAVGRRYTKSIKATRNGVTEVVYPGWALNPEIPEQSI